MFSFSQSDKGGNFPSLCDTSKSPDSSSASLLLISFSELGKTGSFPSCSRASASNLAVSDTTFSSSFRAFISPTKLSRITPSASGTIPRSSLKFRSSSSFRRISFAKYSRTLVFLSKAFASPNFKSASRLKPSARFPPSPPVLIWFTRVKIIANILRSRSELRTSLHAFFITSMLSTNSSKRSSNWTLKSIASNFLLAFLISSIAIMYFSHSGKTEIISFVSSCDPLPFAI
mmetsp:Transcript_7436/g.11324  ORF Transcript_7436/g.11324 Transcript_7436/m.11324 type:complete len:231 (-) Transcript_7436:565-1257(-)